MAEYRKATVRFLADRPVCEVWLEENGYRPTRLQAGVAWYEKTVNGLCWPYDSTWLINLGAPRSTEVHHKNKRRGKMLNDQRFWLAVCRANHERIERDKKWARAKGFLLNF